MVLGALINHPERLNRDTLYELRSIVARYPYFQTARLLLLNNLYLLHEPDFGAELRRSVLYISDRAALSRLIEGYMDRVLPDEVPEQETAGLDRTLSLIDAFLGTLPDEADTLHLPIDAVGDYATRFLAGGVEEEEQPVEVAPAEEMDLIDRFISQQSVVDSPLSEMPPVEPNEMMVEEVPVPIGNSEVAVVENNDEEEAVNEEESLDESYFTETLAKIYIKQRKYSRALEIIRSLYLKYPEKNIYFADQIRFLEKLIINNNSK